MPPNVHPATATQGAAADPDSRLQLNRAIGLNTHRPLQNDAAQAEYAVLDV